MRVLVAGAGGQLGHGLVQAFGDDDLVALDHAALDVTDEPSVWAAVRDHAPEVVVNAAGFTAVDRCEADPEPAWHVNAGGAANLARACEAAGALLVQISTADVFDGTLDRPYTEFDPPAPRSVYARTKEAGEQLVRQLCPGHQIVRTTWLQGAHGDSFVRSVLRRARGGERVTAVDDQVGNPTFVPDLAAAIRRLAALRRPGTFHVTNGGSATWNDLAAETVRLAGLDARVSVTNDAAGAGGDARPANRRLEGRNARLAGLDPLPDWRDGLARLLEHLGP